MSNDQECVILYVNGDYSGSLSYPFSLTNVEAWPEVVFFDHGSDTNFEWSAYVGVRPGTEDEVIRRFKAIRLVTSASVTTRYQRPFSQRQMTI